MYSMSMPVNHLGVLISSTVGHMISCRLCAIPDDTQSVPQPTESEAWIEFGDHLHVQHEARMPGYSTPPAQRGRRVSMTAQASGDSVICQSSGSLTVNL